MQHPPRAAHRTRPLASAADRPPGPYPAHTSLSNPLADARVYRPGAVLALSILVLPAVLTLGLAALALQLWHALPVWLPVLALLWLPAAPLAWLAMQSVRTTSIGIAVGRPWRTWLELRWEDIRHIDQRALFLRINGPSPTTQALLFTPRLLSDGGRLRREILMRLPPAVLSVELSREAAELVHPGDITISAAGDIAGTVKAHTRARYWAGFIVAAVVLLAAAAAAYSFGAPYLPQAVISVIVVVGALVAFVCLALAAWIPQRLTLDASGVTIAHALILLPHRSFAWQHIDMVEFTPRKALLRIRGKHRRALCAGPRLFNSEQSAIAWRFIESHCNEHDVLLTVRPRLP